MLIVAVLSASALLGQQVPPGTPLRGAPEQNDSASVAADGQVVDGQVVDGQAIDGQAAEGQVVDGQAISAQAVIDRYINATGGLEAWRSLRSIRGIGTLETPGLPFEGRFIIDQTTDAYRMSIDMFQVDALGKAEHKIRQLTVRNGDMTWQRQGDAPASELQGQERDDLLRKSTFNPMIDAASRYASMTLEGMDEVNGRQCWKLSLVPVDTTAGTEIRWFDVEQGLQRKIAETPRGGGVTDEVFLEDYRPVGAVTLNHVTRVSRIGRVLVRTFEAMQTNVTIDQCLFEAPEELATPPDEG